MPRKTVWVQKGRTWKEKEGGYLGVILKGKHLFHHERKEEKLGAECLRLSSSKARP